MSLSWEVEDTPEDELVAVTATLPAVRYAHEGDINKKTEIKENKILNVDSEHEFIRSHFKNSKGG